MRVDHGISWVRVWREGELGWIGRFYVGFLYCYLFMDGFLGSLCVTRQDILIPECKVPGISRK